MREKVFQNRREMLFAAAAALMTLLPCAVGAVLWERLPEQMAVHWGLDGKPNGWASRGFAVFGLPAFMLALHAVCVLVSGWNGRNSGQNPKLLRLMHGLCPGISLVAGCATYADALGVSFSFVTPMLLLTGALLIVVGNYLPKCRQNPWMGIRVKWTLADEDNWAATHRVGGRVWVAAGAALMLCAFLPQAAASWALIAVLIVAILIPVGYSYAYARRQRRNEEKG